MQLFYTIGGAGGAALDAGGLRELGCFCVVFSDVAAAVRIHPLMPL